MILEFCTHCVLQNQRRTNFSKGIHDTMENLDCVHFDHWGPSKVFSKGSARYMLTIVVDFSKMIFKKKLCV